MLKKKSLSDVLAEERSKRKAEIGALPVFETMRVASALSTGNLSVDSITGVGGLPTGRIIELFGPPSSGKTTTALQAAALVTRNRQHVMFLDYEKSLDEKYVRALGVDVEGGVSREGEHLASVLAGEVQAAGSVPYFIYYRPKSFEDGMNLFRRVMETGQLKMLIVDSVAQMTTEHELEAETGKAQVADRAKMMAQLMRQVVGPVSDYGVCTVFLNHIQEILDASPMGQKLRAQGIKRMTTPGGNSLKFNASMRIEYKQVGNMRSSVLDVLANEKMDVIHQTKVQVTVVKNKVAPPFRQAVVRVRYGRGFSQAFSVKEVLTNYGVVREEAGGVYRFTEETKQAGMDLGKKNWIKGEENFIEALENDSEWLARLEKMALEVLAQHGPQTVDGSGYDADGEELSAAEPPSEEELKELLA